MTDREILKQALEALEYASEQTKPENLHGCDCLICTTILALRDRLAQPKTPDVTPEVTPDVKPVQVSPLEFIAAAFDKEFLYGKPIMWAEWPNREKNGG